MEHNKSVKGAHDEKMTSEKSFLHSKAPISFDDEPLRLITTHCLSAPARAIYRARK